MGGIAIVTQKLWTKTDPHVAGVWILLVGWRRRGIDLAVNLGDHVSESTPGELTLKPFRPLNRES